MSEEVVCPAGSSNGGGAGDGDGRLVAENVEQQPGESAYEARVRAFKSDPQLMEAATRFVTEVLERAKEEAMRRSQQDKIRVESLETETPGAGRSKRGPWHSRARGVMARFFATLCLCNSTDVKT